jgi:PAS domain S-box-containing protein
MGTSSKNKDFDLLVDLLVLSESDAVLITSAEEIDAPDSPVILFANDVFCRMCAYTQKELIGKTPGILQGPKTDRPTLDKIKAALKRKEQVEAELINYRKDGSEYWVKLVIKYIKSSDRTKSYFIAIEREITENKLLQLKLHENEQKVQSLFDLNPDPVFLLDSHLNILDANQAMTSTTGYLQEQLLGSNIRKFFLGAVTDAEKNLKAALEGIPQNFDVDFKIADGSVLLFQVKIIPLVVDNSIAGLYFIAKNITVLKQQQMEKELLLNIGEAIINAVSLEEGLQKTLETIGNKLPINIAEVWLPDYNKTLIRRRNLWFADKDHFSAMQDEAIKYCRKGSGLPGKAYSTGEPIIVYADNQETTEGLLPADTGWKEAVLVPVFTQDELAAIFTFYTQQTIQNLFTNDFISRFQPVVAGKLDKKKITERLDTFFKSITDAMCIISKEGKFIHANQKFEELVTCKREEIIGKTPWDLFSGNLIGLFNHTYDHNLTFEKSVSFKRYYPPLKMWLEISVYPSKEGLLIYFKDITKEVQLQHILLAEKVVLEMSTSSRYTVKIMLDTFLRKIQEVHPDLLFSVLSTDVSQEWLVCTAAPGLPEELKKKIKRIAIRESNWSCGSAAFLKAPVIVTDIDTDIRWARKKKIALKNGILANASFPIFSSTDQVIAVFAIYLKNKRAPSDDELMMIDRVVSIIASILEKNQAEASLKESHKQLRSLTAYIQSAREKELKYLAREIHDELGQLLTAMKIDVSMLQHKLKAEQTLQDKGGDLEEEVNSLSNIVNRALESVRTIVKGLRPVTLDDQSLLLEIESQAEEFSRRTRIDVSVVAENIVFHIGQEKATEIYRIIQECLTNVARHANASLVAINIRREENKLLVFEVVDNGIGFNSHSKRNGRSYGLLGMRERALMIGGELNIVSAPGEGTKVKLSISNER